MKDSAPDINPADIGYFEHQLGKATWQIANDRLLKPGRIAGTRQNGLQSDKPLSDTSAARKPVGQQYIGKSGKRHQPEATNLSAAATIKRSMSLAMNRLRHLGFGIDALHLNRALPTYPLRQ